jgi:hypothetical protein
LVRLKWEGGDPDTFAIDATETAADQSRHFEAEIITVRVSAASKVY